MTYDVFIHLFRPGGAHQMGSSLHLLFQIKVWTGTLYSMPSGLLEYTAYPGMVEDRPAHTVLLKQVIL